MAPIETPATTPNSPSLPHRFYPLPNTPHGGCDRPNTTHSPLPLHRQLPPPYNAVHSQLISINQTTAKKLSATLPYQPNIQAPHEPSSVYSSFQFKPSTITGQMVPSTADRAQLNPASIDLINSTQLTNTNNTRTNEKIVQLTNAASPSSNKSNTSKNDSQITKIIQIENDTAESISKYRYNKLSENIPSAKVLPSPAPKSTLEDSQGVVQIRGTNKVNENRIMETNFSALFQNLVKEEEMSEDDSMDDSETDYDDKLLDSIKSDEENNPGSDTSESATRSKNKQNSRTHNGGPAGVSRKRTRSPAQVAKVKRCRRMKANDRERNRSVHKCIAEMYMHLLIQS